MKRFVDELADYQKTKKELHQEKLKKLSEKKQYYINDILERCKRDAANGEYESHISFWFWKDDERDYVYHMLQDELRKDQYGFRRVKFKLWNSIQDGKDRVLSITVKW